MKKLILTIIILLFATSAYSAKYNRKNWKHWIDADKDGQNTRHEILIRDNIGKIKFKTKKKRRVVSGKWICPYTGNTYYKASDMDIDHIVPLKEAWRSGGADWSKEKKRAFANDPENLLAVEDNANQAKGAKRPDQWLPYNKKYWAFYTTFWLNIKNKYGLRMTDKEKSVLSKLHGFKTPYVEE
ncbi:MAG: HNH endonuclease [Desulfobacterales bacterium]|nr:HNH endonuclease [Desulfobacterales bacterium]MCP4161237.1 HNH endonuclease [Deltaproteobacteria bacterium]